MEGFALVALVVIGLVVLYKLNVFSAVISLTNVATREAEVYDVEHKAKVVKRYLSKENAISAEDVKKVNVIIKSLDDVNFN
jgi:hypothetical protein